MSTQKKPRNQKIVQNLMRNKKLNQQQLARTRKARPPQRKPNLRIQKMTQPDAASISRKVGLFHLPTDAFLSV